MWFLHDEDTLTPTDAVLEIGSGTVRLGSASGAWKDLEAGSRGPTWGQELLTL